jgi:(2Fe-2S) ferredoxin
MKARDLSQPMSEVLRPPPAHLTGTWSVTVCINERPQSGIMTISCGPRGGFAIAQAIEAELVRRRLPVRFATIKCLGLCEDGPNVRVTPSNSWFHGVRPDDVARLVDVVEEQMRGTAAAGGGIADRSGGGSG